MKPIITFFFACWMMDGSALSNGRHKNGSLSSLLARDGHNTLTGLPLGEWGALYIPVNGKGLARSESSYRISLWLQHAYSIPDCRYLKDKDAYASRDSSGPEGERRRFEVHAREPPFRYPSHEQPGLIADELQAKGPASPIFF
ncbi:MAG TPA: hypothetical protein VK183_12735 [Flavobacterium sp.]|nr:hypothetical protein [Flavobacterium sp.]